MKYIAPLVGAHFRPPAKAILSHLPAGQLLHLDPEPDNPYDSFAVRVIVRPSELNLPQSAVSSLTAELIGYGSSISDFIYSNEIHLGYLPTSGGKFDTLHCGNREFLEAMQGSPNWTAYLSFAPDGKPLVLLTLGDKP